MGSQPSRNGRSLSAESAKADVPSSGLWCRDSIEALELDAVQVIDIMAKHEEEEGHAATVETLSPLECGEISSDASGEGSSSTSPRSAEKSGRSYLKKWSRLESLQHLAVDEEMIRGISLRHSLQQLGQLWRTSPVDLAPLKREGLWHKSKKVAAFDVFLSHSWLTPGRSKMLSLTLQLGWKMAVFGWLLGTVLAILLTGYEVLPGLSRFVARWQQAGPRVLCPLGPWAMILGFLGVALALLLLPYVPDRMAKKDMAFLDVVSIHQTDEELMERGIYGLGGFLSVSKELRVLWSKPYLSRLWCVFELAAYRSANPNGVISFSPLFVEQAVFILAITGYISTGVFWVSLGNKEKIGGGILWVYVLAFGPLYVAMHFLRKNIMAKHQLLWQLESFDVDQAQCRTAFDKEFIYRAIAAWYGSPQRFNEYVRGPLRQELLGKSATGFPWYYGLFVTSASMSISIDVMLGHYLGGAPPERVGAHFFSDTLGMNCFWTLFTLKIILLMCDRLAMACCKSVLLDYLQSLLVCAVHTGIYFLGLVLGKRAYEGGIHWSLAWCGFAVTLVFLSYSSVCRLAVKSCCRLRGEGAKGLAPEPSCADTAEKAVFEAPASKQVEC